MWNAPVCSIRMNLIPFQLCAFFGSGIDDDTAFGVNLHGHLIGFFSRVVKDIHEHLDDILISMVVIIVQDDVIARDVDHA